MKKLLLLLLLFSTINCFAQEKYRIIWEENFNGYQIPSGIEGVIDGDPIGIGDYHLDSTKVKKWTIDVTNADLKNFADFAVVFRNTAYSETHFAVQDVDSLIFATESIDVSSYSNISASILLQEVVDHEPSDYVDVAYNLDGGGFTLVSDFKGLGTSEHTLVGNDGTTSRDCEDKDWGDQRVYFKIPDGTDSVKIRVTFKNGSSELYRMDDLKVTGTPVVIRLATMVASGVTKSLRPVGRRF